MSRTIIVGGGIAAWKLLQALSVNDYSLPVTLISQEQLPCYNRVLLPEFLAGNCTEQALSEGVDLTDFPHLTVLTGTTVIEIDSNHQTVRLDSGEELDYKKLILATGALATQPKISGIEISGVHQLRAVDDARWFLEQNLPAANIVVVGGGLLGLEAAYALSKQGANVTVVHRNANLLNRQIDTQAANQLRAELEELGLSFVMQNSVAEVLGNSRVTGVRLDDNSIIPASLVLFAAGTQPNTQLAASAGIEVDTTGIITDRFFATSAADTFALGECAQVNGYRSALVSVVTDQAKALAQNLAGISTEFVEQPGTTRLKVGPVELFVTGELGTNHDEDIFISGQSIYRRLHFINGQLKGAVLLGDTRGARLIAENLGKQFTQQKTRAGLVCGLEG